jgi:ribosomal protein L7Ae-like RNA K-turn-binding protein
MDDRVKNLLGLAKKAGFLLVGMEKVRRGLEDKKTKFLIIANDAGLHSRWETAVLAERSSIPYHFYSDKKTLGAVLGQTSLAIIGVTDENMAREIRRILEGGTGPMVPS